MEDGACHGSTDRPCNMGFITKMNVLDEIKDALLDFISINWVSLNIFTRGIG